jgi:CheY-like chemotaxis protein
MEHGGRVIVCDDTPQIRQLIRVNLELEGYDVEEVADGQELLDELDAAGTLPGVVTLDAIPVVMVTASVQHHDRVQARASGFDAFVSKPFDPDDLVTLVHGFMAEGRAYQAQS